MGAGGRGARAGGGGTAANLTSLKPRASASATLHRPARVSVSSSKYACTLVPQRTGHGRGLSVSSAPRTAPVPSPSTSASPDARGASWSTAAAASVSGEIGGAYGEEQVQVQVHVQVQVQEPKTMNKNARSASRCSSALFRLAPCPEGLLHRCCRSCVEKMRKHGLPTANPTSGI
jgi:hypothetical protein